MRKERLWKLQEGESYKYLGVLEADKYLEEKMKLNVLKEYIRRLILVKTEWWEFSLWSYYLGSIPIKIFSSIC